MTKDKNFNKIAIFEGSEIRKELAAQSIPDDVKEPPKLKGFDLEIKGILNVPPEDIEKEDK